MDLGPDSGVSMVEEEDDEESVESLVTTVLLAVQKVEERVEKSMEVRLFLSYRFIFCLRDEKMNRLPSRQAIAGSEEGEGPELTVPQAVLHKLLARSELLSPQQHLQMYGSLADVSMDFGKRRRPVTANEQTQNDESRVVVSSDLSVQDNTRTAAPSAQFNASDKRSKVRATPSSLVRHERIISKII